MRARMKLPTTDSPVLPDATDDEVFSAAHAAHCDTFIKFLDEGYDTLVAERGVKLSGPAPANRNCAGVFERSSHHRIRRGNFSTGQ